MGGLLETESDEYEWMLTAFLEAFRDAPDDIFVVDHCFCATSKQLWLDAESVTALIGMRCNDLQLA